MVIVMTISFKSFFLFFFFLITKHRIFFPMLKTRSKGVGRKYVICERKSIIVLLIVVLMVQLVAIAQLFQNWSNDRDGSKISSL